ncbi:MAG TPA: glutamate synthase, partial [Bacteroidales bacterium]|nr:glutamate synthase [Bacteroidales bacterium]
MMMQAGKYNYCACGRTENNPFCDGSHYESTDIKPILVVFELQQEVKWCDCRNS